jgi:iron complex outermembrane recepter protein
MFKFLSTSILLFALLLGSLTAVAQRTITGTVTSGSDKKPLPEAIILLKGTNIGTVADDDGKYTIGVPDDKAILIFTYIGFQSKEMSALQNEINVSLEEGVDMDNVVVIGTRNASRTKIESAVPVDIIPIRTVVNEVGQVEINQILHYLAPSFQSNRQTIADGTDFVDPGSLRGLGPDHILVLVNGKRRHSSALVNVNGTVGRGTVGTDISAFPAAAIERIEILRDGAAAQYGSDAIAGVINIVLKKDVKHLVGMVTGGTHKTGDGTLFQGGLNYGFKVGKRGFVNMTGEYTSRGYTNRMKAYTGPIYNLYKGVGSTTPVNELEYNTVIYTNGKTNKQLDDEMLKAKGLERSSFNNRLGNAAVNTYGAMVNAMIPINDSMEVFGFGGYNEKAGVSANFYTMPVDANSGDISAFKPAGFLPILKVSSTDLSGSVGLRGRFNKWTYEVSNTYGRNILGYNVNESMNVSQYKATGNSQSSFNAGKIAFTQNTVDLDFGRKVDNLFNGTNFAFGAQYRTDTYVQTAGEEASYKDYTPNDNILGGAKGYRGSSPDNNVANTRSTMAIYGDMEADFTERLMMGIALRYEQFSDYGDAQIYKLVGKYKFTKQFMVRGSMSSGFHAPSQQQKFYNGTTNQIDNMGNLQEISTLRNDDPIAKELGIPKLTKEQSVNYSLGFGVRPNENFELTLDGYVIEIQDRIILTGQFTQPQVGTNGYFASATDSTINYLFAERGIKRAAFFANAVDTRTIGADLVGSYKRKFGAHDLRFVLALNMNNNKVVSDLPKTSLLLKGKENTYFNREDRSRLETVYPDSKITFSVNWKYKKMWAMMRNVYFGQVSYISPDINPNNPQANPYNYLNTDGTSNYTASAGRASLDQTFAPKITTDLTFGYNVTSFLNASIGASNLFDIYPDQQTHSENVSYGRFQYSRRVQQFGFNGAYYFARLRFDLHK